MSIATKISFVSVIFFLLYYCARCDARREFSFSVPTPTVENNRPIIGVLTQEISYQLNKKYPNQYHSYIAASYVKFIEGAGGRVVPIWIGKNRTYYEDILNKVNGVLWPGGATYFNQSRGYAEAGAHIYRIARRMNRGGDYFPLLGICLGFELLTYVAASGVEHRTHCNSMNQPLPLTFEPDFANSKLFRNAPIEVINVIRQKPLTANYHNYCVTKEALAQVGLSDHFQVLSTNRDYDGLKFISTLEHVTLPFYGLQFHPEKNLYEWMLNKKIPHSRNATSVAQYFANFFVDEARKNQHAFPSPEEEKRCLIYNYPVTYTGMVNSLFVQCYMFPLDVAYA